MQNLRTIETRNTSFGKPSPIGSYYSNKNVFSYESPATSFNIDIPEYITYGGSLNYYGQDSTTIFTSINTPFIRFIFTSNTYTISGTNEFVHKIYKLDDDTYKQFQISGNNRNQVINLIQNPFYEIRIPASAVTTPTFDLFLGDYIKATGTTSGSYSQPIYEDKSQYFISSYFAINNNIDPTYIDPEKIIRPNQINIDDYSKSLAGIANFKTNSLSSDTFAVVSIPTVNYPENNNTFETFNSSTFTSNITAATFSGVSVEGRFFTYFTLPNKPIFQNPIVNGSINTFSPRVYFSNVDDGDEYIVQVVYDLTDTGFTTNKSTTVIPKNINPANDIQSGSFNVKSNSFFRYRVGNVKKITNIFDINQKIVTFSDQYTGQTTGGSPTTFVIGENDSPYVVDFPTPFTPPSLSSETSGSFSLSGNVSGSIVSAATLNLVRNSDNYVITITSSSIGDFSFTGLASGSYTLETIYRGYETHYQNFNINSNTAKNYVLAILWDNNYETWATKANDIIT